MKKREKLVPDYVPVVGAFLMCIGNIALLSDNNGGINFVDTFRFTLICVGCWLIAWWFEWKRPTLLTKMSEKRLRFHSITMQVCCWVSLVLVIFVFCFAVYQM